MISIINYLYLLFICERKSHIIPNEVVAMTALAKKLKFHRIDCIDLELYPIVQPYLFVGLFPIYA